MEDENDWIMRQINSFARGLGVTLSKGKAEEIEVVFPQKEAEKLPHQTEIEKLLDEKQYAKAAHRILQLQYGLSETNFVKLGTWFYSKLSGKELRGNSQITAESLTVGLKKIEKFDENIY